MRKHLTAFAIIFSSLITNPCYAQKTKLTAALIDDSVLLTSSFSGAKLTIFGAVEAFNNQPSDIIIVARGPDRPAWISQKYRILGLWIGQKRINFEAAPTFYGIASNRPLSQIAAEDTLRLYGVSSIGQLNAVAIDKKNQSLNELKTQFVKERNKQGLYFSDSKGVNLVDNHLFRADLKMPDLTPPGLYTVKVMIFRNRRPVDSTLSTFVVRKVGIERAIYSFSKNHKITHALLGVILALSAGFLSARIFSQFVRK